MKDLIQQEDYRDILKLCFAALKERNPRLSLSSIARKTGTDRSFLSLLLSKKRQLDVKKIDRFATAFQVPADRKDYFFLTYLNNLVQHQSGASTLQAIIQSYRAEAAQLEKVRKTPDSKILPREERSPGEGTLVWRIQSLAALPGFQNNAHWIKERLSDKSASLAEIQSAVAYLLEKKLIQEEVDPSGQRRWKKTSMVQEARSPMYPGLVGSALKYLLSDLQTFAREPLEHRPWNAFGVINNFDAAALDILNKELAALKEKVEALAKNSVNPQYTLSFNALYFTAAQGKKEGK